MPEKIKQSAARNSKPVEEINIRFSRLDQTFAEITSQNFDSKVSTLQKSYGPFFDLYLSRVLRLGDSKHPLFKQNILHYLSDPDVKEVFAEIQRQYPQTEALESLINKGFNRYHMVFPDSLIPEVAFMNSGLNRNIAVDFKFIGVGLDLYLGEKFKFYQWLGLPKYKLDRMNSDYLVPDLFRGFLMGSFQMEDPHQDLLGHMIYHGKIMYFCTQLLPEIPENRFLGYSPEQLDWCRKNESLIWSLFIDKKLFYSSDLENEVAYIDDGPFTPAFRGQNAPAKLGVWLGYQIVKSYMEKNESAGIQELMSQKDSHVLFSQSGYKPGKI